MADSSNSPLHTQIQATLAGQDVVVSIFADSAEDLLHQISVLTGQQSAPQPTPQPEAQPAPTPAAAQPTPTQAAGPTPSGPTAANVASPTPQAAPAPAATSAPAQTTSDSADLTLNDVLAPARQLLQKPGGEDTLRQILANNGAEAISQADPAKYGAIKAGIEQALAQ